MLLSAVQAGALTLLFLAIGHGQAQEKEESGAPTTPRVLRVSVIRCDSGEPVPGARVFLQKPLRELAEMMEPEPLAPLWCAMQCPLLALGHPDAVTDSQGMASVILDQPRSRVVVRAHGLVGMRACGTIPEGPLRVSARRDAPITAVVRDGRGSLVAGAPVSLVANLPYPRFTGGSPYPTLPFVLWRGHTDASGRVSLADHFRVTATLEALRGPGVFHRTHLVLATPGTREQYVVIERANPPKEPIPLRMPATVALVVDVVGADGSPFLRPVRVCVGGRCGLGDEEEDAWPTYGGGYWPAALEADTREGSCRFPRVGLGGALKVLVVDPEGRREPGFAAVSGPRVAGDEIRVRVAIGPEWRVFTGRAVAGEGRPLADQELVLELEDARIGTDRHGRFRYRPEHSGSPDGWSRESPLSVRTTRRSAGNDPPRVLEATISLPADLPPGHTDLGDIAFTELPLVLAGRLVDDAGNPVASAVVRWSCRAIGWLDRAPPTDEAGRFQIHADLAGICGDDEPLPEDLEVKVTFSSADTDGGPAWTREIVARVGTTDLDVTLGRPEDPIEAPPSALAGSVLLDPEVPSWMIIVSSAATEMGTSLGLFRRFALAVSERPRTTIGFRVRYDPVALLEVEDVPVAEGAVSRPSELAAVDLRGRVHELRFALREEDGTPLEDPWIEVALEGVEEMHRIACAGERGLFRVWSARPRRVIRIRTWDRRTLGVEVSTETADLTLAPPVTVRCVLTPDAELPERELYLVPDLEAVAGSPDLPSTLKLLDDRRTPDPRWRLRRGWSVRWRVPAAGRYRVGALLLDYSSIHGPRVARIEMVPPRIVEVPGDGEDTEVAIPIDSDCIAAALRSLRYP